MNGPEPESPKKRKPEKPDPEPEPESEPADNDDNKLETVVNDKQPTKRLKKKIASEPVKDEMTVDPVDDAGISSMEEEDTKVQEDDNVSAEKEAEKEEVDIEDLIQEAARKRASEFKSQAE